MKKPTPQQMREAERLYRQTVEKRVQSNSLMMELVDHPKFDLENPEHMKQFKELLETRQEVNRKLATAEKLIWTKLPNGKALVEWGRRTLQGN